MKNLTHAIVSLFLIGVVTGCGGSGGSSDSAQGTLHLSIMAANSDQTPSPAAPAFRAARVLSSSDFQATSIASGPPQELTIAIKRMELIGDGNTSRTIFNDSNGKPFTIEGSQLDLSSLFTNYACVDNTGSPVTLPEGQTCSCGLDANNQPIPIDPVTNQCTTTSDSTPPAGELAVSTGAYNSLKITYLKKSRIKGCVTGNFSPLSVAGTHTYCTRTAFSTFNSTVGGQNSDFESLPAEVMDFDLSGEAFTTDGTQTITIEYPIKDGITISEDGTSQLTLFIDANRLLRFYNQGRNDQGANPNMPTGRSYFFTTVFDGSTFAFVGRPGTIRGYSWVTQPCTTATLIPADHVCSSSTNGVVAGWLTLVSAADSSPLLANFMPDDDNTFTVIKGSNKSLIGTHHVPDSSLITTNADSTLTIGFSLGSDGTGTVFNFHPDLAVGESNEDSYFEGLHNSYGTLVFKRGL